jgi:hypothetical protein
MSLIISYFTGTRYLNVELKIRPDIRYPAHTGYPVFRLAGYPAKSVSGASLVLTYLVLWTISFYYSTLLYFVEYPIGELL